MVERYVGTEFGSVGSGTVVREPEGTTLDPSRSQSVTNHSPDGFQCGYTGSGPAQLALALLLDVTDDEQVALNNYQDFKNEVIAKLGDEWSLSEESIRDYVDT